MTSSMFTRFGLSALLASALLTATMAIDAAESSNASCLEGCEQVLPLCRKICHDTEARTRDEYGDDPHKPVHLCVEECEEDLAICKGSCDKQQ